ncbi:hypothetical protein LUZ60_003343 [Juncus effusus]|nr:hypothetical protein LUZ60_003343 [Juncus effusus]
MPMLSTKLQYYSTPKPTTQLKHHSKCTKFLQNQQLIKKKCSKQSIKAIFDSSGDDFRTIKRIMKFNSAIQNRSMKEFFELACDEYKYFYSLLPPFDPISFTKRAFVDLYDLMPHSNVTFVLKPTPDGGFDLGLIWTLVSKNYSVPLGLGCNLHTSHLYKGNMLISQANNLIQPLIHITSLPKKIKEKVMELIDKIFPEEILEGKKMEIFINILISLIITVIGYILLKKYSV